LQALDGQRGGSINDLPNAGILLQYRTLNSGAAIQNAGRVLGPGVAPPFPVRETENGEQLKTPSPGNVNRYLTPGNAVKRHFAPVKFAKFRLGLINRQLKSVQRRGVASWAIGLSIAIPV
jgi:hypothetical protein